MLILLLAVCATSVQTSTFSDKKKSSLVYNWFGTEHQMNSMGLIGSLVGFRVFVTVSVCHSHLRVIYQVTILLFALCYSQ